MNKELVTMALRNQCFLPLSTRSRSPEILRNCVQLIGALIALQTLFLMCFEN